MLFHLISSFEIERPAGESLPTIAPVRFEPDFIRIPTLVAEQVITSLAPPRVQQEEQEHRQQQAEHRQQQAYLHNFTDIP